MTYLPEQISRSLLQKRIPTDVTIELTYKCHLDCVMCYLHSIEKEMTTKQVKDALDKLQKAGTMFLLVTGGETFLRKDLFEILDYATDLGFVVDLKTTGTFMAPEAAKKIKEMRLREVHISLLGSTAEVHDKITTVKGSFDKAIAGVRMLQKENVRVKIKSVITHGHVDEVEKIDNFCKNELGIRDDYINFDSNIFPKNDFNRLPLRYRMTDDELRLFHDKMRHYHVPEFPKVEPNEPIDDMVMSCSAGINGINIIPNGDVYACMSLPFTLGNITRQSIKEIMYSPANEQLLENIRLSNNEDCSNCGNRRGCFRCPGMGYLENGTFGNAAKENCRHTQIIKEVVYSITD